MNLSRGGIMMIEDVIVALKIGRLSHFASDVLANERLESYNTAESQAFDWLNDQDNVILTPHVAGWTNESYERISMVLADKIETYINWETNKAETHNKNRQIVG